jgi:hypothetical protein
MSPRFESVMALLPHASLGFAGQCKRFAARQNPRAAAII